MSQKIEPSYYANIPATVRYDKAVPPNAKLLYGEVTALCNKEGFCWAGNPYFADLYEVHKDTVSAWINKLKERGYIRIEIDKLQGNIRRIYLTEKMPDPIGKNAEPIGKNAYSPYGQKDRKVSAETPTPIGKKTDSYRQKRLHNNKENNTQNNTGNNTKNSAVAFAPVSPKSSDFNSQKKKEKKAPRSDAPPLVDPPIVTRIRALIESKTPGYYWKGADGNAAKEIAAKLQAAIVGNRPDFATAPDLDEKVLNALSVMIERTSELKAYYHYSDLPNLNKKYNEIFTLLKSTKQGSTQQNGRTVAPAHKSASDRVSNLNSMFDDIDSAFS